MPANHPPAAKPTPERPDVADIWKKAIEQLIGTGETAMDHRVPELCEYVLRLERLIADAPDHATVARLLCSKVMRWEGQTNELCFDGLRYSTSLDESGVPQLTNHLRAAIAAAERAS